MYPKILNQLIEELKKLPGVGNKTAERYALHLLSLSSDSVHEIATKIIETKEKIHYCENCGNFTENVLCDICLDQNRDKSLICVVAEPKDILAIERINQFHGYYHVLGGLISPINQVMPDDLSIDQLIAKTKSGVNEVILALNPTMEGETTAYYIAKKIENDVNVSVLAQGLPMGGHLEYADEMTLTRSMKNRKKFDF